MLVVGIKVRETEEHAQNFLQEQYDVRNVEDLVISVLSVLFTSRGKFFSISPHPRHLTKLALSQ